MRDFNSRRLLFDTGVLLDAVCKERPQSAEACEVLRRCLKDAYYVLQRQYNEVQARRSVEWLRELLVIAPMGAEECELSLGCGESDFEDGLIRACAELNDVDVILTRDVDAFKRSKVRAMTCAEYLELFG